MIQVDSIKLLFGNEPLSKYLKIILFFIFYFTITKNSAAQNSDLGTWNILNLRYHVNNKLSFFSEAQLRSLKFYNNFHYYEYKAGLEYKANEKIRLGLGAGSYQTYKEGGDFVLPKNNSEFRIWPQIILSQPIGKILIEQRYRAELRFTSRGYRNRFRYRLGLSYPFGKQISDYKPFQIAVNNEIFFSNKEPYFERNRLQFVFNYRFVKTATIQIGYLHQFDYQINKQTGHNFLVLGFYYEIFRSVAKQTAHTESKEELHSY